MSKAASSFLSKSVVFRCVRAAIAGGSVLAAGLATSAVATAEITDPGAWRLTPELQRLQAASCPDITQKGDGEALHLGLTPLPLSDIAGPAALIGATLSGAWELASTHAEFGGLSGLVVMPDGNLLAVGDNGLFISLEVDRETQAPTGFARLAPLRDAAAQPFRKRRQRDAEGLAFQYGVALVSFEHDHRILAYHIGACGLDARGIDLMPLRTRQDGVRLMPNLGAEALSLSPDASLRVGVEARGQNGAVTGRVRRDGQLEDLRWSQPPALYLLTGHDQADGLTAMLFRAYDPVRGNRILATVSDANGLIADIRLDAAGPVDNFEGIAIGRRPGSGYRLWLISDDNFNPSQRTLLFAFDLGL